MNHNIINNACIWFDTSPSLSILLLENLYWQIQVLVQDKGPHSTPGENGEISNNRFDTNFDVWSERTLTPTLAVKAEYSEKCLE